MFERYTEQARRVVFFARYEASVLGSPWIDTEHLLLGLLREAGGVANRILQRREVTHQLVQKEIEARQPPGQPVSTAVDIPLTPAAKRVLQLAAEEAERLKLGYIGTDQLFLGLMREQGSLAADILAEKGLRVEEVREEMRVHSAARADPDPSRNAFDRLLAFVGDLEDRRAVYQVSSVRRAALRVDVATPEGWWVVTFLPDARVGVESPSRPGEVEGPAALDRLLERLGPPRRTDG
jgi:ATP-dependent Clp protease ATP-binding subunit ClpC